MRDRTKGVVATPREGEQQLSPREIVLWERVLRDARHNAIREHLMKTWGGWGYQVHIERTIDVLDDFGYGENTVEGFRRKIAMQFHDMTEDCGWNFNDIRDFVNNPIGKDHHDGEHVAAIAFALQDEKGKTRDERKPSKLYDEMRAHVDFVIDKNADRIVNRERAGSMGKKYDQEYPGYREKLYKEGECDNLWEYLDELHGFEENKG